VVGVVSVESIIAQLAIIEAGITGIKVAYDKAPEALGELPAVLNFPREGEIERHAAGGIRLVKHSLGVQVFVVRGVLEQAEAELRPFLKRFMDTMDINISINGTCFTSQLKNYRYGRLEYGGEQYLGIDFTLVAEEKEQVSFSG